MTFDNPKALEKFIKQHLASAMRDEVAECVKTTIQQATEETVYSVYEPKTYQRRWTSGGLADPDNIDIQLSSDGLQIEATNVTSLNNLYGRSPGTNLSEIVSTGDGYRYDFEYNGVPRDFMSSAADKLDNGVLEDTVKAALRKRGLDVQ